MKFCYVSVLYNKSLFVYFTYLYYYVSFVFKSCILFHETIVNIDNSSIKYSL